MHPHTEVLTRLFTALDRIAARMHLGGHLITTPANMMKFIQHPQAIDPKNVMPDLGVTDQDVKHLAAFLIRSDESVEVRGFGARANAFVRPLSAERAERYRVAQFGDGRYVVFVGRTRLLRH